MCYNFNAYTHIHDAHGEMQVEGVKYVVMRLKHKFAERDLSKYACTLGNDYFDRLTY